MAYNRFSAAIILLSIFSSLSGVVFFWTLNQDYLTIAKFSAGTIWLLLLIMLIAYINKTNRNLSSFLQTVKSLDSSKLLTTKHSGSFELLNLTYNEIIDSIQDVKISKETEYRYYQSIADNSGSGIICYKENGEIDLINRAAREIFILDSLGKIDGIDKYAEGFSDFCKEMSTGTNELFRTVINGELKSLVTRKSILNKGLDKLSLISIQNIHGILEKEEVQVWQKLINVLTHEIMNSISPIKSLSGTLSRKLRTSHNQGSKEDIELIEGLEAIDKRSKGLMQFAESYQKLSKIPEPIFRKTNINTLLIEVSNLLSADLKEEEISFKIIKDSAGIEFSLDEKLTSQMLINLIRNSIFALREISDKTIEIKTEFTTNRNLKITVTDNGKGIQPYIIDKVFIPFYTTREGGSGIGLSLARQIMLMHNGSIRVESEPGVKTEFMLIFN